MSGCAALLDRRKTAERQGGARQTQHEGGGTDMNKVIYILGALCVGVAVLEGQLIFAGMLVAAMLLLNILATENGGGKKTPPKEEDGR
jgi:hypothetical protein